MTQDVLDGWKVRCMERGRVEGRWAEKLENALGMLRENVSVEKVARGLGLSIEKVRELAAGLGKG